MRSDKAKVPYTLLLADDSVTIQRVIELTFADEDIRVVAVGDGGEAIAMLDTSPPDIVLADVGMPGQNGYEVARHIRNTPRLAHIPVVLLTGAFEPIDQAKVAEVGCDGVLAKPFEPQLVIARVKELLARPKDTTHTEDKTDQTGTTPEVAEPWGRPVEEGPPSDVASQAAAVADIDNYFDRLDAALTKQQGAAVDSPQPSSAASAETPAADPQRPKAPPVFPPLADAFAALLAAEQSGPDPTAMPEWPGTIVPPVAAPPAPPAVPDDIVEQVTRRVLDQMSDRVVRETVGEIVLATAERLVRQELERIKRQIE